MSATRCLLLAIVVLGLAGCAEEGDPADEPIGDGAPDVALPTLRHFDAAYDLTAIKHTGRGEADAVAYGLVLGQSNCVFFVVKEEDWAYQVVRGTATLEWDTAASLYLFLRGEQGALADLSEPAGSPLVVPFEGVAVDYGSPFAFMPRVDGPATETQVPVRLHVEFDYIGDEVLESKGANCSYEEPA